MNKTGGVCIRVNGDTVGRIHQKGTVCFLTQDTKNICLLAGK